MKAVNIFDSNTGLIYPLSDKKMMKTLRPNHIFLIMYRGWTPHYNMNGEHIGNIINGKFRR